MRYAVHELRGRMMLLTEGVHQHTHLCVCMWTSVSIGAQQIAVPLQLQCNDAVSAKATLYVLLVLRTSTGPLGQLDFALPKLRQPGTAPTLL